MKDLDKYIRAYNEWYCVSCGKYGETPVSFDVYMRIMPTNEVDELIGFLDNGINP